MAYTILIADDEKEIRDLLRLYLEKDGYQVLEAENGIAAVALLEKEEIDMALLDIMMPELDGYQVLKRIRESSNIPVMILSAKNQDSDKILGLDLGADDYLSKPFNPMEAMARINSNIRRFYSLGAKSKELKQLKVKDLRLDTESCLVYKNDEPIDLTSVEYKLLRLFMENPGKVYTKQQVYENVWGEEYAVADNNIMVCISRLRAKLSEDNGAYIRTIRGLGYRMEK
ncbi:response regulator transcription factor [Petralouisia muris]|uniref:Response regulator transcription factor n=1 Tax=Petralouisia muris TaxID=3032872 RepID=A0AC61RXW9_9FIRM|nr:response regulator transcription factor [Petralouisia muris]TGY96756.1 response regulator transcription factor [Petralouisia muris]